MIPYESHRGDGVQRKAWRTQVSKNKSPLSDALSCQRKEAEVDKYPGKRQFVFLCGGTTEKQKQAPQKSVESGSTWDVSLCCGISPGKIVRY